MAICVDVPADPDGRWHAKDQLAHLSWWRFRDARVVDTGRAGGTIPARPPTDEEQNAEIYAATKDRPAEEVKREAQASWAALAAALEACSEDDLVKPHPESPGSRLWEVVPGLGGHVGVHLMTWFLDAGDAARAETAARWGYEFECGLLPEGPKRADAAYNLACFYARVGRADAALRLLRDAFRWQPALRDWAGQDPDLEGVRGRAEFRELLAKG